MLNAPCAAIPATERVIPIELHYAQPWLVITDRERANLGHVVPQLLAEPREVTRAGWVADAERLEAGYQAKAAADRQARILNAHLAAAHERAEARHTAPPHSASPAVNPRARLQR